MNRRINILVHGRVQGVGFRASACDAAERLALDGWVRNLPGGRTVEVVAEGEEGSLTELLAWCESGPGTARVERVESRWEDPIGEAPGFRMRWS